MQETAELLFKIQTQGLDALDKAAGTVRNVSAETKYGAANLVQFEKALTLCRSSGETYKRSLELIAQSGNNLDKVTREIAKDLLEQSKAFDKAASDAEKAADKQSKAAEKAEKDSRASFESFAANVRNGITNPFSTAGAAAEGMLLKLGPVGAIGLGIATGLGVASKAALDLASSTGALAEEHLNLSERTGLSVKEVGTFSGAASVANVNIGAIVSSMRTLSQTFSENSLEGKKGKAALKELGVEALDVNGHLRPMGELWLDIADSISKVESPTERARLAIALFGRGGLELMPLLRGGFRDLTKEVERLGYAFTEEGAKKAAAYDDALDKLNLRWQALKRSFGEKIIGIIQVISPDLVGGDERRPSGKAPFFYNKETGKFDYRSAAEQKEQKQLNDQVTNAFGKRPQSELEHLIDIGKGGDLLSKLKGSYSKTEDGKQGRISELNAEIERLRGSLLARDGKGLASEVGPDIEKLHKLEGERDGIQKSIEGRKQYASIIEQVQKLLEQAQLSELTGLAKIQAEREKLLATLGKDSKLRGQINTAQDVYRDAELKKLGDLGAKGQRDALKSVEEGQAKAGERAGKAYVEGLKKAIEQGDKELTSLNRVLDMFRSADRGEIQARANQALRVSQLNNSGPGNEARALTEAYQLRLSLADQLFEQERSRWEAEEDQNKKNELYYSAVIARDKERFAAEREHEVQVLELRKKRQDLAESESRELYQSLKSGDGVGGFLKSKFDKTAEQLFVNATSSQFEQAGTQLANLIPGQFDAAGDRTGIGKLLAGTMLDAGRNQTPVDKNTTATEANTKATEKLEKTLRTGTGGTAEAQAAGNLLPGLTGVNYGDLISFGSDVNGLTGKGGILGGIPGLSKIPGVGKSSSTVGNLLGGLISPLSGGLFAGLSGGDRSIQLADGTATTASATGLTSTAGRVGNIAGSAALIGTAALGVYSGIKQGGGRGITSAIGSGLGAAAAIPGPQQPFLQAGALLAGFVSNFFPDPKKQRDQEINDFLASRKYQAPNAISRVTDLAGSDIDYDYEGRARSSAPPIIVQVQAMDSQSFLDRAGDLADAVALALGDGHKIASVVQKTVQPL